MTYEFLVLSNTAPVMSALVDVPAVPRIVTPMPIKALKRKADRGAEPLKVQIYKAFIARDMAIADVVEQFKDKACKSKVYSAIATLKATGHIKVVKRVLRQRNGNNGAMFRDVYGPASGTTELL